MTPLHFSLTVNPLLSPPSLLSPRSKVLEKNKPPGGPNRGFTVSCLTFSLLPKDSAKSFQKRTAHGSRPEGMSNLFLFPILRECASTIFLNLLQIRDWASLLTCVK